QPFYNKSFNVYIIRHLNLDRTRITGYAILRVLRCWLNHIPEMRYICHMNKELLGIGSRVRHPAYGEGVVIRLHPVAYEVCFMTYGIKNVGKDYEQWEILDRVEAG